MLINHINKEKNLILHHDSKTLHREKKEIFHQSNPEISQIVISFQI